MITYEADPAHPRKDVYWVNVERTSSYTMTWESVCGACYRPIYLGTLTSCATCGLHHHKVCTSGKSFSSGVLVVYPVCSTCSTYE